MVATTDVSGSLTAAQLYDAWGKPQATASLGSLGQYGYTGREPDETGMMYYRARYYDPATGRFTQRDPAGMPDGVNRYTYVDSNPINYTDPSGEVLNFVVGGLVNVGIGYGLSLITGQNYSLKQAAGDFAIGVATSGLGAIAQASKITKAVSALRSEGKVVGTAQVSSAGHAQRIEYEALKAIQGGADRVFLNKSVGATARNALGAETKASGLLARKPDLLIQEGGTLRAIEVASKAQKGGALRNYADEAIQALPEAYIGGETTAISATSLRLPFSVSGVRTLGTSSLPLSYGLGLATGLDVGLGVGYQTLQSFVSGNGGSSSPYTSGASGTEFNPGTIK